MNILPWWPVAEKPPGDAETAWEAPGHCHVGEVGEVLASVLLFFFTRPGLG